MVASRHVAWSGDGYFDSNFGDEPLEAGFRRLALVARASANSDVAVLYEGRSALAAMPFDLALRNSTGRAGGTIWSQPPSACKTAAHRLAGRARARGPMPGQRAERVAKTWIDAPFYARSALAIRSVFGEDVRAVHESLSATAASASPVVQSMLPYRMPRSLF